MSQELLYTSAPRGLKPGSRGFCTVLSTQGMAAPLATALEGLSGYRPIYPAGDERASRNPVVVSHLKLQAAGRSWSVLSRIADYGLDYSQRANKLAHHVAIDKSEQPASGPASLLATRGFMRDEWSGEPKVVALKPGARDVRAPSGPCRAWQEVAGDAGWAGVLAESFLRDPERLVILLFTPGQDILPLFNEALSLLPPEKRWDVTFSTYFTGLATSTTCVWRAMVHDSKEAHESLRFVNALRLDLTSGSLGPATGGDLVAAARSGTRPHAPPARPNKPLGPSEEEFVELEPAHEEFAATDDPSADVRFAGAPQAPPPLAPPRSPQPAPYVVTQPATRRRLADVVAEESNRPRSRRWRWIKRTAVALFLITSSAGLCFVPVVRTQISKYFSKSGMRAQSLKGADQSVPNSQGAGDSVQSLHNGGSKQQVVSTSDEKPKVNVPQKKDDGPVVGEPAVATTNGSSGEPSKNTSPKDGSADTTTPLQANKNVDQQLPQGPSRPTLIELPKKGQSQTLLHDFPLPPGVTLEQAIGNRRDTLPKMLLLKPTWLSYKDAATTSMLQTKGILRSIEFPATTAVSIAWFVATTKSTSTPASQVEYRLQSLDDQHTKMLGWHRIRVLPANPNEPPAKELAFTEFPLKDSSLGRKFDKKSMLRWKFPSTAAIDPTAKPKLVLDRLAVSIGEDNYFIDVQNHDAQSLWAFTCADFAAMTYAAFGVKADISAIKLDIKIDAGETSDGAAIELKLLGKAKFFKPIEDALEIRLLGEKTQLSELLAKIDDMSKSPLDEQLKGFSVDGSSAVMRSREIKKIIAGASERVSKKIESEKEPMRLKELKELLAKLPALVSLYDKIEQYHHLVDSLDNVKIVSVRIYYELSCATKDAAGASTTVKEVVDVVNFDDTKPRGEKKEGAKQ